MKTDSEKPTRKEISDGSVRDVPRRRDGRAMAGEEHLAGWAQASQVRTRRHSPHQESKMPYRCRGCNRCFGVGTGTIMAHSHVSYRNWVITICLLATRPKGTSSMQLHRDLGIKQSTAWLLPHKLGKSRHILTGSDPMSGPSRWTKCARVDARRASAQTRVESRTRLPSSASGTGTPHGPDRRRKHQGPS